MTETTVAPPEIEPQAADTPTPDTNPTEPVGSAPEAAHGFAPFFHLQNPDPLLFTVFAIGYLNLIGGLVFAAFLIWRYRTLTPGQPPAQAPAATA